jgi:hypothetical protein
MADIAPKFAAAKLAASVLALALIAAPVHAQQVGQATAVRPAATQAAPAAQPAQLHRSDAIIRDAELATAANGALEVTFADSSKLSMGPNSTAVVDEFVYAGPSQTTGATTIKYTKGLFRYISGAIPPDKVKIETPTVTIGIRGTIVRTAVEGSGGTTVGAEEHDVTVTSKMTGVVIVLQTGQKVYIGPDGAFSQVENGQVTPCN